MAPSSQLPPGFETLTQSQGWSRVDSPDAVRFSRDDGQLVVQAVCRLAPNGEFVGPPEFQIQDLTSSHRPVIWHIEADGNGHQDDHRMTAVLVGMLEAPGLLLQLEVIDTVAGTRVTDRNGRLGPWHHQLVNPSWEDAISWLEDQMIDGAVLGEGPVDSLTLRAIETRLGLSLPHSYWEFLARVGSVRFHSTRLFGTIGEPTIVQATVQSRAEGLHEEAVGIGTDPLGGVNVIDLRRPPTAPVLRFDLANGYDLSGVDRDDNPRWAFRDFEEYLTAAVELAAKRMALDRWKKKQEQSGAAPD